MIAILYILYSGVITLTGGLQSDPKQSDYNLELEAFDFGSPQMSSNTTVVVRVPVNYPPELDEMYIFQVLENVTVSHHIGHITAVDPNLEHGEDDKLKFYIREPRTPGNRPK